MAQGKSSKKAKSERASKLSAQRRAAAIRRTRFFDASEPPGECLLARARQADFCCSQPSLTTRWRWRRTRQRHPRPHGQVSLPLFPVSGCRAVCHFVAGSVDSSASRTSRCSRSQPGALLRDARECCCLVLSCVFRVSMLDGSLCFELCLQPAVCVLFVAAQDLTLAV